MRATNDQVHYLVVVSLLHLLINACMRELFRIPLEFPRLALFWVLLAFLDQPFWLLQLSISNVSWITTSMLAFQVPHLVYLQKAASPYTREKWPLSKNHSWYSLKMTWMIDPSDGLNLVSNLDSFFKSFYFFLFKSFSFYQMILNHI